MAAGLEQLIQYIRRLVAPPEAVLDAALLDRFVQGRDQVAFAALVARYGPMVLRVCGRVLADPASAEDCFQATFLVLARKAGSLRRPAALAGWLHGVALRVAANAQKAGYRRRLCQLPGNASDLPDPHPDPLAQLTARELLVAVDEEVQRLPEVYRLPVILCCFENLSQEKTALRLGWTLGSVKARLERGRKRLGARLAKRGLTLPATFVIGGVSQGAAAAAVGPGLRIATVKAAILFAGGVANKGAGPSGAAVVLAEAALHVMVVGKLKMLGLVAVLCAVAIGGAGSLALQGAGERSSGVGQQENMVAIQQARNNSDQEKNAAGGDTKVESDDLPLLLDPDGSPLPTEAVARIGSTRLRHLGDVTGLVYSPDGKWLASVSTAPADATARVWDASTGKEHFRVKVSVAEDNPEMSRFVVRALGFSSDVRQFLVIDTTSIRGFDIANGKELFSHPLPFKGPAPIVTPIVIGGSISPDGKIFSLVLRHGALEIRDVATGVVLRTGEHPFRDSFFVGMEWSADSRRLVLCGSGDQIPVFNVESGRKIAAVDIEKRDTEVCFLPGGETLAVLQAATDGQSKQREVRFFELKESKLLRTVNVDLGTYCIAMSPDGKMFAAGNVQKWFAQLIDTKTGKEVGRVRSTPSTLKLAFSPNGQWLAGTSSFSGAISVWDIAKRRYHPNSAEPKIFNWTRFAPDDRNLILLANGNRFLDWQTGIVTRPLADFDKQDITSGVLAPNAKLYALSQPKGPILLLDAATGKELRALTESTRSSNSMTFSGDSRRLASCGWDKVIRVWDVATGRELARFTPPELFGSDGLAFSHDGRVLAVSCNQRLPGGTVVYTWDMDSKVQLARIEAPTWFFSRAMLSPDGRLVAGGGGTIRGESRRESTENAVIFWEAATGRMVRSLPKHAQEIIRPGSWCTFSPDGRLLATGDAAGRLRLWEVASGREAHRFEGHHGQVYPLQFSQDGKLLLAASVDAPCFMWDVAGTAGKPLAIADADYKKLWADLAAPDAKLAFQSVRRLVANPGPALELLKRYLKPASLDTAAVDKLFRDLDAEGLIREAAIVNLMKLAESLEPRLRKARTSASAEAQQRIDRILKKTDEPTPERLRESRALMALEWIATPEVVQFLGQLAGGAKDDPLTLAAVAGRERLRNRVIVPQKATDRGP